MNKISIARTAALRLALAGICGVAATSAASAQTETATAYRSVVENSIVSNLQMPKSFARDRHGVATLAIAVDANGTVRSVEVVKSSGYPAFDREAIRTARQVSYPASTQSRTLAMVLGFNQVVEAADRNAAGKQVAAYLASRETRLAADTAAQQPDS